MNTNSREAHPTFLQVLINPAALIINSLKSKNNLTLAVDTGIEIGIAAAAVGTFTERGLIAAAITYLVGRALVASIITLT